MNKWKFLKEKTNKLMMIAWEYNLSAGYSTGKRCEIIWVPDLSMPPHDKQLEELLILSVGKRTSCNLQANSCSENGALELDRESLTYLWFKLHNRIINVRFLRGWNFKIRQSFSTSALQKGMMKHCMLIIKG